MSSKIYNLTNPCDRAEFFISDLFGKVDAPLNEDLEEEITTFSDDEFDMELDLSNPYYVFHLYSDKNNSKPVNSNAYLQPKTLQEACEEQIIIKLTNSNGRLSPSYVNANRQYINSLPDSLKYRLWNKILTDVNLEENIRLESLSIFLDKRTKYFRFILSPKCCRQFKHMTCSVFQTILKLIPILAPNIETIDFTDFCTASELKEDFKFLLKTCTKLKSLRLSATFLYCPILDLIFSDFNSLDKDVQIALKKIKIYNMKRGYSSNFASPYGIPFSHRKLSNIFIRLPNLESLGEHILLAPIINHYAKQHNTPLNLTHIYDIKTNLSTLELFAKFCPKAKCIFLISPQEKVVENLYKLPLLIDIQLENFDNNELINCLTRNGNKIKKLNIYNKKSKIDEKLLRKVCPNLKNYTYNR